MVSAYCFPDEMTEAQKPLLGLPQPTDSASDNAAAQVIEQTLAKVSGHPANAKQNILLNRVVDAWRQHHGQGSPNPILILVAGYAGSGKTEFSRFLSDITGWAFIDKDSLTRPLVERLLIALGGDPHDRHTQLYLSEVRPLEYRCLMEAAFDNLNAGTSAVLSAPFVAQLTDTNWVSHLTTRCAARGVDVAVVWVAPTPNPCASTSNFAATPATRGSSRTGMRMPAPSTPRPARPQHT
ncbi:AAA family ATPase [Nonomuraea sp. LPB2021202275-12-8]|uniref:AAA family ATPase n=1 Tax=Nonomuraea sp. LPB2021202275-12-8 TaxID=3120159 RepID=UPI00300C2A90